MFCDNETTFKGAESDLHRFFKRASILSQEIAIMLIKEEIEWTYTPLKAPHFGGLCETNIKSMKRHLYRSLGEQLLTYEELSTMTCQIESFLNSRPLCAVSDQDRVALTPGRFLVGRALTSLPEPTEDVPASVTPSQRWRLIQQIRSHFWIRWSKETLLTL